MKAGSTHKSRMNEIISVFLVVSLIIVMMLIIQNLNVYVRESVHNDRTTYLEAQTETVSRLVNKVLNRCNEYIDVCKNTVESDLEEGADLNAFINNLQGNLQVMDLRLILIDRNCTWYGENGTTGRITAVSEYSHSSAEKLCYMTTGVDVSVESIVFRARLDEPITVVSVNGETEICFCAVIYYMDKFDAELERAFPYECNSFVIDNTGLMAYKNFAIGILIGGSNIFSKYERVNFMYGDEGKTLIERIKNRELTVAEFKLEENEYFICSAPIDFNDWTACFVMNSEQLSAGSYIPNIIMYVLAMGILFVLVFVIMVVFNIRNKANRKLIETQRQANIYLERASTAKSDFLSNMSHDIRTPLNGIVGMLAIAKKENNCEKTNDCLNKIEEASRYLVSLVNDVLDMSSIESGKIRIVNKPVDLENVCRYCETVVSGQMRGRQLAFHSDYTGLEHRFVMADELRMGQVLINILGNAVKYTKDGGEIWFSVEEKSSDDSHVTVEFSVQDTGVGMKKEFLEHIFERFSQEEGGSRTKYKGTGLGMAITKSLVDLMGGTISVESEYCVGSKFVIDITFDISEDIDECVNDDGKPRDISGTRILLVEDNDLNIEIATELLEDEGTVVTTARDGLEAVNTFSGSPAGTFDVILMDIMMPVMNGLEATGKIRSLDRPDAGKIPIIAMTAKAFEEDIKESLDAGMNAHLSKPIRVDELIDVIYRFVKQEP